MAEGRRLHVGVFLGLSASAYAMSLAAVTALQAGAEATIAADRAPTAHAIGGISAATDSLEGEARLAGVTYGRATGTYDRVSATLADFEAELAGLAGAMKAVDGAARSLPDHVALPRITRAVTTVSPTRAHATTGGSGG